MKRREWPCMMRIKPLWWMISSGLWLQPGSENGNGGQSRARQVVSYYIASLYRMLHLTAETIYKWGNMHWPPVRDPLQMGHCCMICNWKRLVWALCNQRENNIFKVSLRNSSSTAPLWSFLLLSLTFHHLKIKSTDGQIFFFGIILFLLRLSVDSCIKWRRQVLLSVKFWQFVFVIGCQVLCVLVSAAVCIGVAAVYCTCYLSWRRMAHTVWGVMLRGARTLFAVVTEEPDDMQASR